MTPVRFALILAGACWALVDFACDDPIQGFAWFGVAVILVAGI